jgi:hypothetical protein
MATAMAAHPRAVLGATLLYLVLAGVFGAGVADRLKVGDSTTPGSESRVGRVAEPLLMDATLIRGVLVPAIMRFAGENHWWAPRRLRQLHALIGLSEAPTCSVVRRPAALPAAESRPRQ